ncbi:MAG: hypothetical protein ACRDIZ_10180 [Actinomycetota bacterium]
MSSRERNLLIILGVIVLAAGGFFLFTTLGGEEEQAAPTPVVPSPPPVEAPAEAEEPPSEAPRVFRFFGGRDPFVPLIVAEAGAAGAETTPAETGEAVEPVPEGAEEEQEDQGGFTGGKMVTVIDVIDADTVQVEVDGEAFTVDEGEQFAENFEVASVSGSCARFLFGDESLTLCKGGAPK